MKHTSINKIGDYLASDGLVANGNGQLEVSLNGLGASLTAVAQGDSLAVVDAACCRLAGKYTGS